MRIHTAFGLLLALATSATAQETVVFEGDTWAYVSGWSAPAPEWKSVDFDPVAGGWSEGPTGIGYADDDDATILTDMQNNYVSVFLRKEIDVPARLDGFVWLLRVRYDDGFVAYIDGEEVARRGIESPIPAFDELADNHEITAASGFDETIPLAGAAAILRPGTHVLAVEVHNATLDSTDLSFSAEVAAAPYWLTGIVPPFGPQEGGGQVAIEGLGFDPGDVPEVWFGGVRSPTVEVISSVLLDVTVPAGSLPGPTEVVIKGAKGQISVPGAYNYRDAGAVALAFDGGDSATTPTFDDEYPEGTIEFWFRRTRGGRWWRPLFAIESPGTGEMVRVELRDNRVRTQTRVGEGMEGVEATVELATDQWYHIALTFDALGHRLIFAGQIAIADERVAPLPFGWRLRIGNGFTQGFAGGHVGEIRSVRFWSAARTSQELRRYQFARLEVEPDLVASWPLDEGVGAAAPDYGPGGLDFVLGDSLQAEDTDPTWTPVDGLPLLAVTDVTPNRGPRGGGAKVQVFGTGFSSKSPPEVLFATWTAPAVTVLEPWLLEVTTPAASDYGSVDVTVRTPNIQATATAAYTYEPSQIQRLVEEGGEWDYFVGAYAPPEDWAEPEFDAEAAGWARGEGGIGYGDGDDTTDVSYMEGQNATLYARALFEVTVPTDSIQYLRLRIRYDDGFVAYLNGHEIDRRNVAGFPPTYDELASDLHEITVGAGAFDEEIDLAGSVSLLVPGSNVLAVEVHNAELDSTDLSLAAELIYATGGAGRSFLRGDADMSGDLSVGDAIVICYYTFLGGEMSCLEAGDVDDDGELTITDPIVLLRFQFLDGVPPAAPYPNVGTDTDADGLGC